MPRQVYEYKVETTGSENKLENVLNKIADDGWRLILAYSENGRHTLIFEREKRAEEAPWSISPSPKTR